MSDNSEFHLERIGEWSDTTDFEVERDRTIAYALATNDPIPAHLEGRIAPPVFAVVPAMKTMADATLAVVPEDLMFSILHGEHDFRFGRPIRPGETLGVRAKPIGIEGKPSGVVVTTLVQTLGQTTSDLVNEQYFVGFFRGGTFEGSLGEKSPDHSFDERLREREPDAVIDTKFDPDQTFRYAEPAGDPMPIHLDDDFARQMGLPGIIMHGLCTNAMLSHVLIGHAAHGDPERLARLAVRFSKPGIPGDTMTTSIWHDAGVDPAQHREPAGRTGAGGADGPRSVYRFESTDSDGEHLIRDGLAELSA